MKVLFDTNVNLGETKPFCNFARLSPETEQIMQAAADVSQADETAAETAPEARQLNHSNCRLAHRGKRVGNSRSTEKFSSLIRV